MPRTGLNAGPLAGPPPVSLKHRLHDEPDIRHGKSRKVARGDSATNRIHRPRELYGFLARAEGPSRQGPWRCTFECVGARWMHAYVPQIPHSGHDAMLVQLNRRTFDAAWQASGIANRVAMRRIASRFQDMLVGDTAPAADLWLYEIEFTAAELGARFGLGRRLAVETWWRLDVVRVNQVGVHGGELYPEDEATGLFTSSEIHELVSLKELRATAPRVARRPLSQALLHALHFSYL